MWRNHGPSIAVVVAILTAGLFTLGIHGAGAVTHAPCSYRHAGMPYIDTIEENVTTLQASATLAGCPKVVTLKTESVGVVGHFQWLDPDTQQWEDQAVASDSGSANRYTRFWNPPRASVTMTAICKPGLWRVHAEFYDGWLPAEGDGQVVEYSLSEPEEVCGSYGGGD